MTYLPILTYHRLLAQEPTKAVDPHRIAVSRNQFRSQMGWLKRLGYRTVHLQDYVRSLKGTEKKSGGAGERRRSFAITFDDGYEELLTLALPVLQEFGFSASVFAVPGEENNRWDDGQARLMSAEDLRTWRKAGMGVGAHTCTHAHLTRVSAATAKQEIAESKVRLEKILDEPVTTLAYPYGETNDLVDRYAEESGFEAAFATDNAPRDHTTNLFRLRRSVVFPRNTVWEILVKAQRWYPTYQDWKKR